MNQFYKIYGLFLTGQTIGETLPDTSLLDNLCSRSSYFLSQPRLTEENIFPDLSTRKICRSIGNEHLSLNNFFQASGIEREMNLESSFMINPDLDVSLFLDYQNPTHALNTGILLNRNLTPNFGLNLGILQPLDSYNSRQFLIGANLKF